MTEPTLVYVKAIRALVHKKAADYINSLQRELQSIRSAEMPVEPKIYTKTFMRGNTMEEHEVVLKHDYDALTAYALKWREEADNQFQYAGRLLEQLNKAESELAAIKEQKK